MNEIQKYIGVDKTVISLVLAEEKKLENIFKKIDKIAMINSIRVISAFWEHNVSEVHFNSTTGYGYSDIGREIVEKVFASVLKGESALVRNQFISGTHALTVALFALLRPNETILSISGTPYDTIQKVIGIKENKSSLKSYNINYEQIDLIDNDFDINKIIEFIKTNEVKVIYIQRSKGYSTRKSISIVKIKKIINEIRKVDKDVIIMVDNCYCEFVENTSPLEVGANIIAGSLIKNLGAGIASNGAYICGDKNLIELCSERLNVPGQGLEVGPTQGMNKFFLQGIYMAPNVVANSLKTAVLTSKVMEKLGYEVDPKYDEDRVDIVESIIFGNRDDLIKYTEGIQSGSAIDSNVLPTPFLMPGYSNDIIMASGSFVQGSSIEISCDAPIREPFIVFQQGSLTYEYGKICLMKAISRLKKD